MSLREAGFGAKREQSVRDIHGAVAVKVAVLNGAEPDRSAKDRQRAGMGLLPT